MKKDNFPYRFKELEKVLINNEVFTVIQKGQFGKEGAYHVKDKKGHSYIYHDLDMVRLESENNTYKYKIGQIVLFGQEKCTITGYESSFDGEARYCLMYDNGKYFICHDYEIKEIAETKTSKNKKENTFILTTTEFIKINQEI